MLFIVGIMAVSSGSDTSYSDGLEQGVTGFDTFIDPYFGITIQEPSDWTFEGDNPWNHADINPWHLPMVPIKELQPTPVDLLLEGKKTMIVNFDAGDDTSALIRLSVEKMPFGTTLDKYVEHTIERIKKNAADATFEVDEVTKTVLSDGNPAAKVVMTLTFPDIDMQTRSTQLLTMYENLAYVIQYDGLLEYYDVHLATGQQVLESVNIGAPQSRAQTLLLPSIAIAVAAGGFITIKIKKHYVSTMRFFREVRRVLPASLGMRSSV